MATWADSRQRELAVARHRAAIVEGLFGRGKQAAGSFDEAVHPRGRGGEWIEKLGGKVEPHAGHAAPIGPSGPDFSPHKPIMANIARNWRKIAPGMDKALVDRFESGDIEPKDLRTMRAHAQRMVDESKATRGTDPVARDRHDLASLILTNLRAIEVRTFGKNAEHRKVEKVVDGRRLKVSSDHGSEAWQHRQRQVQRSMFDPTGVHSYTGG